MSSNAYGVIDQGFDNGISARARELETPVVCPECKSNWFTEQTFNQYSDLAYGGGAGGDLRVINVTPQTIRVCLCGHPYTPKLSGIRGRVATGELDDFKKSLHAAHTLRNQANTPEVTMQQITEKFASSKEIEGLKGRLNEQARELADVKFRAGQVVKPAILTSSTMPEIDMAKVSAALAEVAEIAEPAVKTAEQHKGGKTQTSSKAAPAAKESML